MREEMYIKSLEGVVKKRYNSLSERCGRLGRDMPDIKVIRQVFQDSFDGGFKCGYCSAHMFLRDHKPYFFVSSLDHKRPLSRGGGNNIENLIVCCHRCNIVKSTMSESTFRGLLERLGSDKVFIDNYLNEVFLGGLKRRIEQDKAEQKGRIVVQFKEVCPECYNRGEEVPLEECPREMSIVNCGNVTEYILICCHCGKEFFRVYLDADLELVDFM